MNSKNLIRKMVKGQFFGATFVKKDGSIRKIHARVGVKKGLKGGTNRHQFSDKYLTVYDMQKKQYRVINTDTLLSVRMNGVEFKL